jgi:DNA-binding response OmpR family regulator
VSASSAAALALGGDLAAFPEVREPVAQKRRGSAPRAAVAPSSGAPRILVVDDDECMRGLLRLHLANAGYEVETAEDAVIAMKSIMRRPPELTIVDVDMPYMDGLEFVQALRSDANFSGLPIMFLTARTDVEERTRALGALACLTKPLLAPTLIAAVAAALPGERFAIG